MALLILAVLIGITIGVVRGVKNRAAQNPQRPTNLADLRCGEIRVRDGEITDGVTSFSVASARASMETTGSVNRRIGVKRLVVLGPLALAAPKKRDDREHYLTVTSPEGFMLQSKISQRLEPAARQFVVTVNNLSARATAGRMIPGPTDPAQVEQWDGIGRPPEKTLG